MKRILLSIIVIGTLLLGACGAPSPPPPFPPPAEETAPEAEAPPAPPPTEETVQEAEAPPTPTTHTLSVSVSPSGAGFVSPSGGQYEEGTQVTLTATPASGYTFDYWGGDASGSSPTTAITVDSNKSVIAHFKVTEPEPTTAYLLELERSHWGRGIGSIAIGGTTVSERVFLFIEGSARNIGSETLTSVICVMKCWNGDTLVKSEEYVVGITIEEVDFIHYDQIPPGASFDFDIDTADDPAIDNVTIEFKDSLGNKIPHIVK